MTLCMAALCQDQDAGPAAVVAADRMVTYGGFIEFEHTVPKMAYTSPFTVALIAGDTLLGTRLAQGVAAEFSGTAPRVDEIAERVAERYVDTRNAELENQILALRGLTKDEFYARHASLNVQVTMLLDQAMAQYNLGIELLVAGVDAAGAHVYSIHNPGRPARQHDVIGYAAIGAGGIHALQAMIGFRHSPSAGLRETVFRAYAAKRRAEAAPGVGLDTDMAVVSASGVRFLGASALQGLATLYENYGKVAEAAQAEGLSRLSLEENGSGHDDESGSAG